MDKKLLEGFMHELQNGDMTALDGIYGLMSKMVYLLSLSILRNKEKAKDIMQETFMRVVANINKYKLETNGPAWICRIARNLSFREYTKGNRTLSIELFDGNISDNTDYSQICEDNLLLYQAMTILDVEEREIVMMFAVENYKHREIALIVDKPIGTVQWIYNKAMKKLREQFKRLDAENVLNKDGIYNKERSVYEK